MANIIDVAAYILRRYGPMTTMKLQKLAFYAQAESLAHHGSPLFADDFQAWRGGPVCKTLYARHRGMFIIRDGDLAADSDALNRTERGIVDDVCIALAVKTGNELSARTHREAPWCNSRQGLPANASCNNIIGKEAIASYYKVNPVIR
ncbi:Panacea domain-containing protein [Bifidobacterium leontopitheci]|uniref:Antitoxin SocA-like Panacea domain-containing protein n=1 Tax=Bifidobacterium leontopitheci TaxID=2650774 RepID=A0A6I1GH76_9BIFI|nr:type II toxin-antitoxin system antitoxin SocA domain-containing protein [Bifidobacterium leontopitheci]KAB7790052.1 hypothetical protein F7D09_1397 [Bifidobacterium leontopitheci]